MCVACTCPCDCACIKSFCLHALLRFSFEGLGGLTYLLAPCFVRTCPRYVPVAPVFVTAQCVFELAQLTAVVANMQTCALSLLPSWKQSLQVACTVQDAGKRVCHPAQQVLHCLFTACAWWLHMHGCPGFLRPVHSLYDCCSCNPLRSRWGVAYARLARGPHSRPQEHRPCKAH